MAKSIEEIMEEIRGYSSVLQAEVVQERDVKNKNGNIIRRDYIISVSFKTPDGTIAQDTLVASEFRDSKGNIIEVGLNRKPAFMVQQQPKQVITLTDEEISQALTNAKVKFIDYIVNNQKTGTQKATVEVTVYEDQNPVVKSNYIITKDAKGNIIVRLIK